MAAAIATAEEYPPTLRATSMKKMLCPLVSCPLVGTTSTVCRGRCCRKAIGPRTCWATSLSEAEAAVAT
ncbi:hypothetical protein A5N15_09135 [Rothia kristinae]|uniref:Uncharacterized protein n=1 Tax=Rothia kristinae TaxID=37923 RepID=A0A657IU19_9MICC|nr:hypothetical protein A5N15_09135 [Rothia kristinae]